MEIERFKENQKKSDKLLQKLVNQGVAKVYPKQTPPKVIHKKPVERSSTPLVRQSPPILQEEVKDLPKSNISKTNIQKFLDKQKKERPIITAISKR
jgi:hypothetical protein